jgi:glucose/arabinose dehydrogenase
MPQTRRSSLIFSVFSGISVRFGFVFCAFCLTGFALSDSAAIPKSVTLRNFFGNGFTLERPVAFVEMPGQDSVYAVVQQSGATIVVRRQGGAWVKSRFDSVGVGGVNSGTSGQDGGLLGLAFHPDYAANGRYYLYYVASYTVRANPGRILFEERTADSTRQKRNAAIAPRLLLSLDKPYIYHNGGTLKFGTDGYLYTAIGDGGSSGDPENRAQNKGTLFGKFLRIDVDGPDAFPQDSLRNYAVPADNPFVDSADYLPEIWAIGVRSPWKWDWNPFTGEIWMGDIGQARYEEITRVPRGGNLGWRIREGAFCFNPMTGCASAGLVPPVFTFPTRTYGISVTGGVFFRGDTAAAYHGIYFYGDFGRNFLWAMRVNDSGTAWIDTAHIANLTNLVSLDKDRHGRIFAVSMSSTSGIADNNGAVYILESPDMRPMPEPVRLAKNHRISSKPLSLSQILGNRNRYIVTGLDGRKITGVPSGAFLVRDIVAGGPARLMTAVR